MPRRSQLQSRCISLARLGFFVPAVDAFGSGERGLVKGQGEYHGEMVAASLFLAGLTAVSAAALDPRITCVAASNMLASYVTGEPYEGQRLGTIVPGILRDAGDVAHLAALIAPRRLVIAGGVTGGGQPPDAAALGTAYYFTRHVYEVEGAAGSFPVVRDADPGRIVEALKLAAEERRHGRTRPCPPAIRQAPDIPRHNTPNVA